MIHVPYLVSTDLTHILRVKKGFRLMIADLGGGALDMTSYEVTNSSPLRLKELTSSDCSPTPLLFLESG